MCIIYVGDKLNYINRNQEGILINDFSGDNIIDTSLKKFINGMCVKNLSTYEGRRQAIKELFDFESNIPIYIEREIILYSTKPLRSYDTVFVNFVRVLSYKKVDNTHTKFIFTNLEEKTIEVSHKKIFKLHQKIEIMLKYINNL